MGRLLSPVLRPGTAEVVALGPGTRRETALMREEPPSELLHVPGRSFRDQLCNALDMSPGQQATRKRLIEMLRWTDAVLAREIDEAEKDPNCPLSTAPGGVIRYRGSERWGGADGVGL